MGRRWLAVFLVAGLVVATWNLALFTVPVWMQAMVVQLGEPVRELREPGLYWRIPFIQQVTYFDRRLLDYDASPKEILTRDKQQLVVDNYSRWRIVDPLQFYRTVRDENGAQSRLDDIIYSDVRETLGRHTLRDIVSDKRDDLMAEVTRRSAEKAKVYGIEVVDVRIKRADLPEQNSKSVFDRMRAERQREAAEFRAQGSQRSQEIRSKADRDVTVLVAEATSKSEQVRGEGDGERNRIFADAFGKDVDFFTFYRSMQAYEAGMRHNDTRMVLSPDSEFFRYFVDPSGKPRESQGSGRTPTPPAAPR